MLLLLEKPLLFLGITAAVVSRGLCWRSMMTMMPTPAPSDPLRLYHWTDWLNRDDPSDGGDYELLEAFVRENKVDRCCTPDAIQFRRRNYKVGIAYDQLEVNPRGLVCNNWDQVNRKDKKSGCSDYEVRFFCSRRCPMMMGQGAD